MPNSPALQAALTRIDSEFGQPRLIVNSNPGDTPGVFFWELRSHYRPVVEAEIDRLQQAEGVVESHFYRPFRYNDGTSIWWCSSGYTRVEADRPHIREANGVFVAAAILPAVICIAVWAALGVGA